MTQTQNSPKAVPTEVPDTSLVGQSFEVEITAVAHGGHCIARHEGQVLFVRHTAPGERVVAQITHGNKGDKFLRADAIEIVTASAERVERRCGISGPGGCGGCDWQHLSLAGQRKLKAQVIAEQLKRLAGLEWSGEVVQVPGDDDGLGWRTRVRHSVNGSGQLGLYAHRSHRIIAVAQCPIAHLSVQKVELQAPKWPGASSVEVIAPGDGGTPLVVVQSNGRPTVPPRAELAASVLRQSARGLERVRGRTWVSEPVAAPGFSRDFRVSGSGFWQVHPGAASVLVEAVLAGLDPQPGEQALDLYCGVGVFAAALAERVGEDGAVLAVESDPQSVRDARRNLHNLPQVGITVGRVEPVLAATAEADLRADLVVLDPPREGAGATVVAAIAAVQPRAISYVACDPAALARDLKTFAGLGYHLKQLQAFDCFPMTQHVECVATLTR